MLKFRLKKWQLVLGLALAVVLIGILALSVVAQDGPGGGETGAVPNKFSEVDEEETSANAIDPIVSGVRGQEISLGRDSRGIVEG